MVGHIADYPSATTSPNLLVSLFRADRKEAVRHTLIELAKTYGFLGTSYLLIKGGSAMNLSTLPELTSVELEQSLTIATQPFMAAMGKAGAPIEWELSQDCDAIDCGIVLPSTARRLSDIGVDYGLSLLIDLSDEEGGLLTLYARSTDNPDLASARTAMPLIGFAIHTKIQSLPEFRFAQSTARLSCREKECIAWAAQGKNIAGISAIMGITERTVLFHISNAKRRLDADTIAHAVFKSYA
ncbi:helix-turn-helix transcriptional regulator [Rhizorhapis suberifaciens]|uniref:DNA-binding CsgD family transcriptional regulator n=1 Tax=Rhizorhapis suberifaciens TaxID=13656 RepID=A0A840HSQ3_9SPHN|nr:LuxR C-terminal-related transcriptional regulator [Rhizorhapis suberifaciens]MBB4640741.1 DNA-binding CsgD family transcriptional regulator [Rhizorhapis suberifaciens]